MGTSLQAENSDDLSGRVWDDNHSTTMNPRAPGACDRPNINKVMKHFQIPQ